MRRFTKALTAMFLIVTTLAITECKKDTDPNSAEFKIVKEYLDINATSASITGSFEYPGKINSIKVAVGQRHDFTDAHSFLADIHEKEFEVTLTGLTTGTEYRYRYEVDYGSSKPFITEAKTFTTQSESPTVKTLEVLAMDSTTFRIKSEVLSDGGQEVTERGICWNTFGDPTMDDGTLQHPTGGLGQYTIRMENLALGKKYYVRAYAKNAAGKTGLSEEVLDFKTEAPAGASVDIELSCNPEVGGTASGGGSYEVGTQCTVTAEANSGYTFVNWTENGNQVSSETIYTFTVTTGRNLVANFTNQSYVITADVTPDNSGTVTGAHGYNYGEECTLTATANNGYDFVKWTKSGNTVSNTSSYTFTVTESANYVAHFSIKSYSVSVSANPTNGGTVSGGGTFNYGESRTVHATPADGFAFTNWTDDGDEVSTDADYTFTVSSNRNLVANFTVLQPNEYSVTVSANPSEGGTVTGSGTYQQGQSCMVKATSKPNFFFVNWTENGNHVSDLAEYTFNVTNNRILVANFEAQAPTEYTVSASASPSNGGSVTGGGTYEQGQQCTLTATTNYGYYFTDWTESGNVVSTQASYTFTVNSNRILVANFTIKSYTINASANPTNGGSVSGGGNYNYGQSCTLSATAATGYTFIKWTENGNQVSTSANYTFTVTESRTLVANFTVQAPNTYTINVSANPSNGGSVTGGGSYNQGASCTVTATANTGYTFLRWTENGNQVSTNANYTFTVTGNRTLVAQFQVQSYNITASANPTNGGSVSGGGNYNYGQSCTLTATSANGYTFIKWTENGNQVSTNPNYTFTVNGNRTLVAQFQQQSYTITASANPTNGGSVSGGGNYNYGQSCTVSATANIGYTFTNWTENGNVVSTNVNYTFTVTSSRILVAHFTAQPQAPTGAINGLFSVSATQQVYFSQGNLQYLASTNTWRFATNQYDYVGSGNSNISQFYNGLIDLFGWGTSGYNHGAVCYQPWSTSQTYSDYYVYGSYNYNLYDQTGQADWGYNPISSGGNIANQWRTLTENEWNYVFNTRNTTSGLRYVKAQVNNVSGVILLPDDWSTNTFNLNNPNNSNAAFSSNIISATQWTTIEAAGVVFLPAAGGRQGTSVFFASSRGYYWSASRMNNNSVAAYVVHFNESNIFVDSDGTRYYGYSVRLVHDAQ